MLCSKSTEPEISQLIEECKRRKFIVDIKKERLSDEQIADCGQCCHAADPKIWCCRFGFYFDKPLIKVPSKGLILPDGKIQQPQQNGLGCCGKILRYFQRGGDIIEGYIKLARNKKHELTDVWMGKCIICPFQTWFSMDEYFEWFNTHKIEIVKNFDDLSRLPNLPKKEKITGTGLFCMLCKCFMDAKTRIKDAKCPKGRW
jgi:hypothetical protein